MRDVKMGELAALDRYSPGPMGYPFSVRDILNKDFNVESEGLLDPMSGPMHGHPSPYEEPQIPEELEPFKEKYMREVD